VVVGTYSSIFVASPVLIAWEAKFAGIRVRATAKS
jgi:preprotein translocase subunit SecF